MFLNLLFLLFKWKPAENWMFWNTHLFFRRSEIFLLIFIKTFTVFLLLLLLLLGRTNIIQYYYCTDFPWLTSPLSGRSVCKCPSEQMICSDDLLWWSWCFHSVVFIHTLQSESGLCFLSSSDSSLASCQTLIFKQSCSFYNQLSINFTSQTGFFQFFFHFLTPGCNGVFHWLSVFFSIFSNYPVFFISAFLIHVFETASHLFNVLKVFLLLQLCIQMFWNDPTLHFRTFSVKGHSHHIFHITFCFFFFTSKYILETVDII